MKHAKYFIFSFLFIVQGALGQTVEKTVSKVISSKAAKGSLYYYHMNEDAGHLELTYLIKEKGKSIDIETYSFDKETLDFVESKVEKVDKSDARFKRNEGPKGDRILRIFPSPISGQIKLQTGYFQYSYVNRAVIKKFIKKDQVKPKGDDGEKLVYVHQRTEEADQNRVKLWSESHRLNVGDVQLFAIQAEEPSYTKFMSLVYDAKTLDRKYGQNINLPYSYMPICADNLPNGHIAIVLKPVVKKDFPKWEHSQKIVAKFKIAPNYKYRYLQLNTKGEVVYNMEFDMKEPESGWTLGMDIVPGEKDGEVMVVGTMKSLKLLGPPLAKIFGGRPMYPEVKNIGINVVPEHFFAVKIVKGKQVFSKDFPAEQIIGNVQIASGSSTQKPESMKKYFRYVGLMAHNFKTVNGKTLLFTQRSNTHTHIMQFDESGNYETNYLLSPDKKLALSAPTAMMTNSSGKPFLIFYQQPTEKDPNSDKQQAALMQRTAYIMPLNVDDKTIGKMTSICPNASIDPYDGMIPENKDQFMTLANGRKKEIVLSRVLLN